MFWTDSTDWKKIAENIRHERMVLFGEERRPIPTDISMLFFNIQSRFDGIGRENGKFVKREVNIDFEERKAICELLFEIYQELNTLKPMGRNYRNCFDAELIDMFIKTFKMANDYNGQSFSSYGPAVISWLEDYKKTYFNENDNVKQPDYTR